MKLEQFAKAAGVKIVGCGPEWGGRIAYTTMDSPNCTTAGFRTEQEAYKSWLKDAVGERTAKVVMKLLKTSNKE